MHNVDGNENIDSTEISTQHSEGESESISAPQLLQIELRVLGSLMEKQLTTPDAYPLTLNSIITACNQKSSREPVSNYQQGELARTLQELADRGFVRKEHGSRSDKYEQRFVSQLGLGKKQQALLCVMMLRGPQTLSELHTRTQRMCEFVDKEDLELSVDRLCERGTPYAIRMGQQPGQRGERIGHLFSGTPATHPDTTVSATSHTASASRPDNASDFAVAQSNKDANSQQNETIELLEMEVAELNQTVSSLQGETVLLRQQLETLYKLTGQTMPGND